MRILLDQGTARPPPRLTPLAEHRTPVPSGRCATRRLRQGEARLAAPYHVHFICAGNHERPCLRARAPRFWMRARDRVNPPPSPPGPQQLTRETEGAPAVFPRRTATVCQGRKAALPQRTSPPFRHPPRAPTTQAEAKPGLSGVVLVAAGAWRYYILPLAGSRWAWAPTDPALPRPNAPDQPDRA